MIRTPNIPCGEDTIQLLMARQPGEWAPPPHSWTLVGLSFPPIQPILPSCPAGKGKQQWINCQKKTNGSMNLVFRLPSSFPSSHANKWHFAQAVTMPCMHQEKQKQNKCWGQESLTCFSQRSWCGCLGQHLTYDFLCLSVWALVQKGSSTSWFSNMLLLQIPLWS